MFQAVCERLYRLVGGTLPTLITTTLLLTIALLLLPIPPLFLDILLTANLALATTVLLLAVRAGRPGRLSFFPALLIVSMVFRLGLNVSALRLILTDGFAGRVIDTVGSLVMRGDPMVGMALFLILASVQYLVVARGGERVAEVAARFVLDALPGQQSAIEADLRAGIIGPEQAQERRALLNREAHVYGTMDGALRFVKGDVIAGMLVLAIGLMAGLWIGVIEQRLTFAEAISRYALLTIGDGIATQIPILLTAVAASFLLTQTPGGDVDQSDVPPSLLITVPAGVPPDEVSTVLQRVSRQLGFGLPTASIVTAPGDQLSVRFQGISLLAPPGREDQHPLVLLEEVLRANAADLLGIDEVQHLVSDLSRQRPALVRETVPRKIGLPKLKQLLRSLIEEAVLPLDLRAVLEGVSAIEEPSGDVAGLTEQVRARMGLALVHRHIAPADGGRMEAVILDAEVEGAIREGIPRKASESLAIEPDLAVEIRQAIEEGQRNAPHAALLCHGDVRRHLRSLIAIRPDAPPVLAYHELPAGLELTVVGRITPSGFVS